MQFLPFLLITHTKDQINKISKRFVSLWEVNRFGGQFILDVT